MRYRENSSRWRHAALLGFYIVVMASTSRAQLGQGSAYGYYGIHAQSPPQETSFKPEGPVGAVEVLMDDNGKPLIVENQKHQRIAVQGHWRWWAVSDGRKVARFVVDLVSPEVCSEYLRKRLLKADVLKRELRVDEKGNAIGERIVAILHVPSDPLKAGLNDSSKTLSAIICTNGTRYSEVSSDSLDNALAFEKSSYNDCH